MPEPYYHDDWLTIYQGDARAVLPKIASDSVDCIVTSPPYWGLRDYGTAAWAGGDEAHQHIGQELRTADVGGPKQQTKRGSIGVRSGDCACGAVRADAQLGLEPTPEEYVANLVSVFRELRRVLKPSGTCWLNLGDSYNGSSVVDRSAESLRRSTLGPKHEGLGLQNAAHRAQEGRNRQTDAPGLKPKDLVGIPWRVAFALQADGWYLRSDIIWAKPNPMPESVTDRPTKAHEYLFLLTKSARYYFDADAVRESAIYAGVTVKASNPDTAKNGAKGKYGATAVGFTQHDTVVGAGRNLRSVWTIATRPYPGAHFAVFPPELPERCIKAGSSERGVCPDCGAPWERVVERGNSEHHCRPGCGHESLDFANGWSKGTYGGFTNTARVTDAWKPSCRHTDDWMNEASGPARPQPAVVLDPFAGSGTTGMVANRLSRRAILIDLNGDYLKQQLQRNAQTPLGLAHG